MSKGFRTTSQQDVPVLTDCGALVVEGTLAGCVAAWTLAQQGCRTVLATSGCSVPHEHVVVRRPWTRESQWKHLPEPFVEILRRSTDRTLESGEKLLNLSRLAAGVEDLLLDDGVRLFYGLAPCGVEQGKGGVVNTVIFGGKSGLQAIRAGRVIDATSAASLAHLSGAKLKRRTLRGGKVVVRLAAKVKQAERAGPLHITRGQISEDRLQQPDEALFANVGVPELCDDRVTLHGPYAQIDLRLPVNLDDPFWPARLSVEARRVLVRIGQRINERRKAEGRMQLYFHRFAGGLVVDPIVRISAAARSRPFAVSERSNLWVCGPAADVDDRKAQTLADPYRLAGEVAKLVDDVLTYRPGKHTAGQVTLTATAKPGAPSSAGKFSFADAPALHSFRSLKMPRDLTLPVLDESDVLVVGGGTSGMPAALAAAMASAKTTLIEHHSDLGGVRTIGGVGSYWFGRTTPFQKACDDGYDKVTTTSGMAEEVGMMHSLLEAGVTVLAPCPVIGIVRHGDRVAGVVVATADGLAIVSGKVVVDATGDADLAAWADAPYEYGNGRDAWTLWGSFANFNHDKRTANRQYESSIEVRDPWDFTRTIVRARRRPGMWRNYEHEMPQHYVAPRETRRITADVQITYSGILAGETFADVMVICESNFDVKGIATSDVSACGVVSSWNVYKKFAAAVPYRAILPRGVSNVLVAGRSYSASHDAISLARMQRDMVSLGGAAGVAAATSAATGVAPAHLDVAALQQQWVRLGMLKSADFKHFGQTPAKYTRRDAEQDCKALLAGTNRLSYHLARLMRSKASITPLRQAFATTRSQIAKIRFARALCYLGDRRTVPFLLQTIEQQIKKALPRPRMKCLAVPPEHAWAAEPVYSLRAISLAGEGRQAIPVMMLMARKIEDNAERFASKTDSLFEYVLGICRAAERAPCPEMIAPLQVLLMRRCLRDLVLPYERDMRFCEDPVLERRAYLELAIGRALARCGDARGYEILVRYVDDVRGTLARSASDELADLLGRPLPRGVPQRRRVLEQHLISPGIKPFVRRFD